MIKIADSMEDRASDMSSPHHASESEMETSDEAVPFVVCATPQHYSDFQDFQTTDSAEYAVYELLMDSYYNGSLTHAKLEAMEQIHPEAVNHVRLVCGNMPADSLAPSGAETNFQSQSRTNTHTPLKRKDRYEDPASKKPFLYPPTRLTCKSAIQLIPGTTPVSNKFSPINEENLSKENENLSNEDEAVQETPAAPQPQTKIRPITIFEADNYKF